ncbi:hypothetical protein [Sedimentitalea sp.]|uniref:hypothetical protein n=1 Tax=Sedimentitalea sp. TaxID=2048915 RepID=UPI003297B69D
MAIDEELGALELDYRQRLASALALLDGRARSEFPWPTDVPKPTADRQSFGSVEALAAFDLVALALTFTFLHEFRQVMFLSDGNMPARLAEEEIAWTTGRASS